jgi:hypothetical protein
MALALEDLTLQLLGQLLVLVFLVGSEESLTLDDLHSDLLVHPGLVDALLFQLGWLANVLGNLKKRMRIKRVSFVVSCYLADLMKADSFAKVCYVGAVEDTPGEDKRLVVDTALLKGT